MSPCRLKLKILGYIQRTQYTVGFEGLAKRLQPPYRHEAPGAYGRRSEQDIAQ